MKKVTQFTQLLYVTTPPVKNVMIIDDDDCCHYIMAANIESSSFSKQIVALSSPIDALDELLDCIAGHHAIPDVIFLDINMPEMNGWEFLEEYEKLPQQLLINTKIIMLSSSCALPDIERANASKYVFDYILKPISIDKLNLLMQKIITEQPILPLPA